MTLTHRAGRRLSLSAPTPQWAAFARSFPHVGLCACSIACVFTALAGCQVGPRTVPISTAHYSDAVRVAQSEQLLVNLVRLRYRDHPVYLSVSSISTQFEIGGSASINGTIPEGGTDTLGIGAGFDYAERPTITFGFLSGERFERDMLEPISVRNLALLAESGWRADRVLRMTVEDINGLHHASTASGPTPGTEPVYSEFLEAVGLIQTLADAGAVDFEFDLLDTAFSDPIPRTQLSGEDLIAAAKEGIEFKRVGNSDDYQPTIKERRLVLRITPNTTTRHAAPSESDDAHTAQQISRLRELLKLDPTRTRYEVVSQDDAERLNTSDKPYDANRTQIVVNTRSLLGVLYFLSHGVRPPTADIARGSVTETTAHDGTPFDWDTVLTGLFRVDHAASRPRDAAVAVAHRGTWFSIRDNDETTKSSFLLLRHLFTLQSGERPAIKPVLTLPVGR